MAKEIKEFTAWAIDTHSTEGHGLLGRYFFSNNIPPSTEGCLIALFTTRAIARQYCKKTFKDYTSSTWKPQVIKVKVIIQKVNIEWRDAKGRNLTPHKPVRNPVGGFDI